MRPHPFLRAYMAGITVPVLVLLLIVTADAVHRAYAGATTVSMFGVEVPRLERALLFPMALVPNLWGAWNAVYLAIHRRSPGWPLGLHGALLVPVLLSAGVFLLRVLDVATVEITAVLPIVPVATAVYYLAWKFLVGFLNRELGIA